MLLPQVFLFLSGIGIEQRLAKLIHPKLPNHFLGFGSHHELHESPGAGGVHFRLDFFRELLRVHLHDVINIEQVLLHTGGTLTTVVNPDPHYAQFTHPSHHPGRFAYRLPGHWTAYALSDSPVSAAASAPTGAAATEITAPTGTTPAPEQRTQKETEQEAIQVAKIEVK